MNLRSVALLSALALAGVASAWVSRATPADTVPASATVTATPPSTVTAVNPQQNRMKSCQADATSKGLKGAERQTFVNDCLKTKPATVAPAPVANAQQQRMKTCQAQASAQGLKGSDRTTFLSGCLKSK